MTLHAVLEARETEAKASTPTPTPSFADLGGSEETFYEVIDGQRREMPIMSAYTSMVATRLTGHLFIHATTHNLGEVVSEALFRLPLAEDAHRNRRPDVAFVSFERWPADRPRSQEANAWDVVPDLAVEVISPNDLAEDQLDKVLEYFRAGVRQVWVIYPRQRLAYVYESPGRIIVRNDTEALEGGAIVPGFQLPLASLFDQPQPQQPQAPSPDKTS